MRERYSKNRQARRDYLRKRRETKKIKEATA
jgi:hypothetical protein